MRLHVPALAAIILAGLAGCTTEPSDPHVVTSPEDYTYLEDPKLVDGSHVHDYWGGSQVLDVLDAERTQEWLANGGSYSLVTFRPPADSVVPLGTAEVHITTTWQDLRQGTYGQPELWVTTAADSEPRRLGQVQSGDTVVFQNDNNWSDLPHQRLSAWQFHLALPSPPETGGAPAGADQLKTYHVRAEMKVQAVRGLEIPPFPGHPDHWQNETHLPIAFTERGTLFWLRAPPQCGYCSGGLREVTPMDGAIVPPGTSHVEVTLEFDQDTPTGITVLYHGADTREWKQAPLDEENSSTSGLGKSGTKRFIIPVDRDMDGPYAQQSLWEFYLTFDETTADDVGPYRGELTFTAVAVRGQA